MKFKKFILHYKGSKFIWIRYTTPDYPENFFRLESYSDFFKDWKWEYWINKNNSEIEFEYYKQILYERL